MELQIPATPPSVRTARSAVSRDRALAALPADRRDDVVLILSELVSNAVVAAPADTAITVRVDGAPDRLTIEVCNVLSGAAALPERHVMPPADHPSGRGLALVRRMSSDMAIAVERRVLTVTAVVRFDTPATGGGHGAAVPRRERSATRQSPAVGPGSAQGVGEVGGG